MKKIFTVLMCVFTFALFSFAQNGWEKLKGPYGWQVDKIATGNSVVIAGTSSLGLYRSTDDGLTWSEANNGFWGATVSAVSYLNGFFFAGRDGTGSSGLLFRSDDNGDSWSQINTIDLTGISITSFCKNDNYIFAGTSGDKIFRSSDNGLHWTQTSNIFRSVTSVKCIGNNLFVGTSGGVYINQPITEMAGRYLHSLKTSGSMFQILLFLTVILSPHLKILFINTHLLTHSGLYYLTRLI